MMRTCNSCFEEIKRMLNLIHFIVSCAAHNIISLIAFSEQIANALIVFIHKIATTYKIFFFFGLSNSSGTPITNSTGTEIFSRGIELSSL